MKALLLLPPPADVTQAYLSAPSLCAVLRRDGVAADQRDLGLEAFHYLTSAKRLGEALRHVRNRPAPERKEERWKVLASGERCVEWIDEAKRTLRDPAHFYDGARYVRALNTVRSAMALIAEEASPVRWTFNTYGWPGVYDSSEMFARVEAGVKNPLGEALEVLLDESIASYPFIGLSVTYPAQMIGALVVARRIRQVAPESHLCVGGALLSPLRKTFVDLMRERDLFDSVVVNEGETALRELVQQVEKTGRCLEPGTLPPNTITPHSDWTEGGVRAHQEDLDALPTPDFEGLPMDDYLTPQHVLLVSTSRGCYYRKCAFCTVSLALGSYRHRAPELVIQDMRRLSERYATPYFFLSEDSISPVRMRQLSGAMVESGSRFIWQCEARLETGLKRPILEKAYQAGCRRIMFGVESASQRVLNHMKKAIKVPEIHRVLRECKEIGIGYDLLTFIGFPTETRAEAQATIGFLFAQAGVANYFTFGSFLLQRDAPAGAMPEAYGVTKVYPPKGDLCDTLDYEVKSGLTQQEARLLEKSSREALATAYPNYNKIHYGTHVLLFMDRYKTDTIAAINLYEPFQQDGPLLERVPEAQAKESVIGDSYFFNRNLLEFYRISPEIARVLRRLDGRHSLDELVSEHSQGDPVASLRLIRTLSRLARLGGLAADGGKPPLWA